MEKYPIITFIMILMTWLFKKGLITYTNKNLTNPETFEKKKSDLENIYENEKKAMLRLLVKIISPKILKFYDRDDNNIKVPVKYQNWTHIALFECDLNPPKKFKKKSGSENYQEWLGKFTFGKWILSDIDFSMNGNPLFEESKGPLKYKDKIFKGTHLDPEISHDIREINQLILKKKSINKWLKTLKRIKIFFLQNKFQVKLMSSLGVKSLIGKNHCKEQFLNYQIFLILMEEIKVKYSKTCSKNILRK